MNNRFLRWGVYLLVAIAFAIACVLLSNWQFDRNESRAADIELVEANYDAPPVALGSVIGADGEFSPSDEWLPVTVTGEYLQDEQVLVRNRPHGGTSAFEIIVPLRAEDGTVLLINRGWVAPGEGPLPDEIAAAPTGPVEVTVRLRPGEPLPSSGRSAPEGQAPTIHLPSIAEMAGEDAIVSAYGELIDESPAPDAALGGYDKPTADPGPHLSYAIQWILFGVMGFVFIAYMIRTEVQKHREEAEGRPARPAKKKRRDRDADAEDELLDARV
ncbi:SURF1 family cytochrome oxidase biogenesis protein [Microbacterium sp. GXF6406]